MRAEPKTGAELVYGWKSIGDHLGRVGVSAVRSYADRAPKDDPLPVFVDHIGIGISVAELEAWKARQRVPYKEALKSGKGRIRRPRS